MESQGIKARVDKPTKSRNNLVIAEKKDGSLRLCLDPRQLKLGLCREHFPMPTFEEVVSNIEQAKVFTVVDQKDSYWQVELYEESADLGTFTTPSDRYNFLECRLEYPAPQKFSRRRHYKFRWHKWCSYCC